MGLHQRIWDPSGNANYALTPGSRSTTWCVSVLSLSNSPDEQQPSCVLCPRDGPSTGLKNPSRPSKKPAGDFDFLSALKPTEGRRWAHVLCSAWIPEIVYDHPATFKLVEGITTIARERWETVRVDPR